MASIGKISHPDIFIFTFALAFDGKAVMIELGEININAKDSHRINIHFGIEKKWLSKLSSLDHEFRVTVRPGQVKEKSSKEM